MWSDRARAQATRLVVLVAVAACVQSTARSFLPSPQNPIYTPGRAQPVLAEYLRLQCPALRKAQRPDTGIVRFRIAVDARGFATRADLAQGSGDQLIDEVFGTVAAQLDLGPDSTRATPHQRPVAMHYRCQGDSAFVTVR